MTPEEWKRVDVQHAVVTSPDFLSPSFKVLDKGRAISLLNLLFTCLINIHVLNHLLLIYICNFHVLNHLLIYICKLHLMLMYINSITSPSFDVGTR